MDTWRRPSSSTLNVRGSLDLGRLTADRGTHQKRIRSLRRQRAETSGHRLVPPRRRLVEQLEPGQRTQLPTFVPGEPYSRANCWTDIEEVEAWSVIRQKRVDLLKEEGMKDSVSRLGLLNGGIGLPPGQVLSTGAGRRA